ncbi:hypothetical protein SK1126_1180 [Streptococcus mitis]|uniref:Uncharacterized protein n=1 Tax=Streptococcus mitis TaxID=28037 RepID=A0A081PRF2_STRMT|nr:hypothetical protein SK1126_1180 [Streptococcus mitis]
MDFFSLSQEIRERGKSSGLFQPGPSNSKARKSDLLFQCES